MRTLIPATLDRVVEPILRWPLKLVARKGTWCAPRAVGTETSVQDWSRENSWVPVYDGNDLRVRIDSRMMLRARPGLRE